MASTANEQLQTMINNMPEKTGKSLAEWHQLIGAAGLEKHGDIMKLLKGEHNVTHGFANTISSLYRDQLAGGAPTETDMIAAQYAGAKAGLRPIYDAVLAAVSQFGDDVEIAPKKTYVSLRRNKQFAIVKAATRKRIDLGLNLKGEAETERLGSGKPFGGMCSHCVRLESAAEVDTDVLAWLQQAYDQS